FDAEYPLAGLIIVTNGAAAKQTRRAHISRRQARENHGTASIRGATNDARIPASPIDRTVHQHRRFRLHRHYARDFGRFELVANAAGTAQPVHLRTAAVIQAHETKPSGVLDITAHAERVLAKGADVVGAHVGRQTARNERARNVAGKKYTIGT